MEPADVRNLRKSLDCTARQLAEELGVEQATVLAWERGDLFPTKQHVSRMEALRARGSLLRAKAATTKPAEPLERLADPAFWNLVRRLATDPKLYAEVMALAAKSKG